MDLIILIGMIAILIGYIIFLTLKLIKKQYLYVIVAATDKHPRIEIYSDYTKAKSRYEEWILIYGASQVALASRCVNIPPEDL